MSSPAPNGRRNGLVGAVLDRVFGFVDKPWKGLFILAVILFGAIGFAVYEERTALFRTLSRSEPMVMRTDLGAVVATLLNTTTAEGVAIFSVNLATDIAQLIIARKRGGEVWQWPVTIVAAIHEQSNPVFLARVIRGETSCHDTSELLGPAGQFLVADGWNFFCMVPEPPSATDLVIGGVLLAWHNNPSKPYYDQAAIVARGLTDQIIQR